MMSAVDMEQIVCWVCGQPFCAPASWLAQRRNEKDTFCCPRGDKIRFAGVSYDDLKTQRDSARAARDQAHREADRARATAARLRKQLKAVKP